jgi:hypothetical protein
MGPRLGHQLSLYKFISPLALMELPADRSGTTFTLKRSIGFWPAKLVKRTAISLSGDALMLCQAEGIEHAAVVGVPFGDPVCAVAERVRGEDKAHGDGTGGEHLPISNACGDGLRRGMQQRQVRIAIVLSTKQALSAHAKTSG